MSEALIEKSPRKPYSPPRVRSERLDAPVLFAASPPNPRCPPNAPPVPPCR